MLAGAFVAVGYVYVYKGIIVGADEAVNGGYSNSGIHATPRPTPRRF